MTNAMTEQDWLASFMREVQPMPLYGACGEEELGEWVMLGHLPRLAASKAFVRAWRYWQGGWRPDKLPDSDHLWATVRSVGNYDWLMTSQAERCDGDVPVTVFWVFD